MMNAAPATDIIEVLVKAEHDFYREKWQKRIEREKSHLTSL
jgi:hypothetical protein